MTIKQISIFIENKPEALAELTEVLAKNEINLRALSLADSSDFGIARIIVDNAEVTEKVLADAGFIVKVTPVIGVEISDKAGSLNHILTILAKAGRNLEYMYGFTGKKSNQAYMIIRCTDGEKTEKALSDNFVRMIDQTEIADL